MKNRIFAWLNLAYRFAVHVLFRMPARALGNRRDYQTFLTTVGSEGYVPLSAAERERFVDFTRCFHCGLCSLAGEPPSSAWDEPWTFVAGPARSLDQSRLVAARIHPSVDGRLPTAVCPAGVPIDFMSATLKRMASTATAP
jgi:hypothetical protein